MAPDSLQNTRTRASTNPVNEAEPLDDAPPSFTMRKASTFHEFSGELAAPPSLRSRSRASSTSSFVSTRVDFPCLEEEANNIQDPHKRPQWLTDAREKACKMYMQTTHSQTRLARIRSRRQPIESESDDVSDVAVYDDDGDDNDDDDDDVDVEVDDNSFEPASDAEIHALTKTPRVGKLLDKLAACMLSEDPEAPAPPDWRQPAQLETFLDYCLQGWETQAELTATNKQMQKHIQQSRRAVDRMQQRIQDLEVQNATLVCYAQHLKGSTAESVSLQTPTTPPTSSWAASAASPASSFSPTSTLLASSTLPTSPTSISTSPTSLTSPTSPSPFVSAALLEEAKEAAMKAAAAAFDAVMAKHVKYAK